MVVRMRKVLAIPWWLTVAVGTYASVHLLGIVITLLPALTVSSVDDAIVTIHRPVSVLAFVAMRKAEKVIYVH